MAAVGGWTGGIKARVREATEEAASVFRKEKMTVLEGYCVQRGNNRLGPEVGSIEPGVHQN